ncbi:hypothetical protein [Cellulosimicrobium sp. TH-20]|uniref:hypothetical protein n=1 Tax=Cellulosimicrobium sp. TH-20 TaxID=1980001 RepID=UPI0011A92C8A|nr:hypothetical protein [Cellulosimicrobium sp. TH-20]
MIQIDPALLTAGAAGITALGGLAGVLIGRRNSRDGNRVDMYSAMGERLARVEGRQDTLERERAIDQRWIAILRDHIYRQLPPPPPERPDSP